jgi:hypothetical protein
VHQEAGICGSGCFAGAGETICGIYERNKYLKYILSSPLSMWNVYVIVSYCGA